ncbi:MAG: sigma-E factor regulatory protein RseB domain-containing protein [Armatimonadota bacterium]|nr:sigma-E factor regulatory protein RseB domain-containing protein [Armatimonadota bacterium]MDR7427163.1 sigma-E factor regulatory protein RseB domain-containing protein [Armatimonadota bacterium]MDR7465057.1 sigma-E factor regulatory protein RseB domain-containing protein [Armatimonadota bacterium]MDR7470468.1 sigma-E factor regulatory protein RseB domain-containing protein [Armatimonadota bacterium]MDR7473554.1 sigma-E factor regulatory protein RseB domain-containing protein [Armatimonadota
MTCRAATLAALILLPAGALWLWQQPASGRQAGGGPDRAAAVLYSALAAPALIDYEGTKFISARRGDRVETVVVLEAHKRPNQSRLEFLSPETLAGRLVVDSGVEAWHYEPSLHTVFQGPSLARVGRPAEQLRALQAAYRLVLAGAEDVIGRPTFVLGLESRSGEGRRLLWIDQATGVPLRVEERSGARGVYVAYFTRVSFSLNLPPALFRFRAPAGARTFALFAAEGEGVTLEAVQRAVGFRVRTPGTLPPGVRFDRAQTVRYGPLAAAALRYTHGTAPISVFQVPAQRVDGRAWGTTGEAVTLGKFSLRVVEMGDLRLLTWEEGGLRLVVVGAQPRAVLLSLAAQLSGR